jgi:hypothetical protein
MMAPGHGPVVNAPRAKVDELITHRLEREDQVLRFLERGIGSPEAMVAEIYPELAPNLRRSAIGQIQAHLIKLEEDGRASRSAEGLDDWRVSS